MRRCSNEVACENTKPGTPKSEWDVSGAGARRCRASPPTSASTTGRHGHFKINDAPRPRTDSTSTGWATTAATARARSPPSRIPTAHQIQPACLTDAPPAWSTAATGRSGVWAVPATAVSGIYFAKLVRRRHRRRQPHRLRRPRRRQPLRPALPDLGHHLAGLQRLRRQQPVRRHRRPAGRTRSATTARSTPTAAAETHDFVFNAEYPMVRFLEANGYDVSYITGVDTDRRGALIKNHKVVPVGRPRRVLVGRAARQRRGGPRRRRQPGLLQRQRGLLEDALGEPSIDGIDTPYRTLVSYKETHANAKIDPTARPGPAPGATRVQPAGRRRPAGERPDRHHLHGQRRHRPTCTVDGRRRQEPAVLAEHQRREPGSDRDHHDLGDRDRSATSGTRTGQRLPARRPDRPVQRPRQTASSYLQDYGSDLRARPRTHHLTLYRAASGALVFGAGTVQWAWGLDGNHDIGAGPRAVDAAMQQATVNLLADMGVQPATPAGRAGRRHGQSTDTTPPTSTITAPAAGATRRRRHAVTISGTATDAGGGVVGGVEVSIDGGTTWHPATGRGVLDLHLDAGGTARLTIKTRAADDSGNIETPGAGRTVTVGRPTAGTARARSGPRSDAGRRRRRRHRRRRGRRASSGPTGRLRSPACASTRARTNTGTHVGTLWSVTGTLLATATFTSETASGLAAGRLRLAGRRHGRHHLRRVLLRAERPLRRRPTATSRPATANRPAARAAPTAPTAPTASSLRRHQRSRPAVRRELLGRRGLHHQHGPGHDAADGHRRSAGRRRDRVHPVTTVTRHVQRGGAAGRAPSP